MSSGWSFKQSFQLRASTMLLLFSGVLILIGNVDGLRIAIQDTIPLWRFLTNGPFYVAFAGLFAFGFLGHSIYKKQPQLQFLVEFIICAVIVVPILLI